MNPRAGTASRSLFPTELLLLFLIGMIPAGSARANVPPRGPSWADIIPSVQASALSEVEGMLGRNIHVAVAEGDGEGVSTLVARRPWTLESRDSRGFTPLHMAALAGRVEMVRVLVERGAKVNARSDDRKGIGVTPLHLATMRGEEGVVEYLLENGADASARDRNGVTPLHMSAFIGNAGIAARLVARCADVNARELEGLTPLHIASDMGARDVVRLLLHVGADVSARDVRGMTARAIAERRRNHEIEELILSGSGKGSSANITRPASGSCPRRG